MKKLGTISVIILIVVLISACCGLSYYAFFMKNQSVKNESGFSITMPITDDFDVKVKLTDENEQFKLNVDKKEVVVEGNTGIIKTVLSWFSF